MQTSALPCVEFLWVFFNRNPNVNRHGENVKRRILFATTCSGARCGNFPSASPPHARPLPPNFRPDPEKKTF